MRVVAEGIAPPAADEVETAAGHGPEKVVTAVSRARELGGLFGGSAGVGGGVGRRRGHGWYGAEVGFVVEDHTLVRIGWSSRVRFWGLGIGQSLRELGGGFGGRIFGGGGGDLSGGEGSRSCFCYSRFCFLVGDEGVGEDDFVLGSSQYVDRISCFGGALTCGYASKSSVTLKI